MLISFNKVPVYSSWDVLWFAHNTFDHVTPPEHTVFIKHTDNVGLVSTVASNDRAKRHEVAQGDREVFASLNF